VEAIELCVKYHPVFSKFHDITEDKKIKQNGEVKKCLLKKRPNKLINC
jgi:hypothetical protein